MVVYRFTEKMEGHHGLSSAVWKELAKEAERREIFERAAERAEQEQQREHMRRQLEVMKLLHPLADCGLRSEPGGGGAGGVASSGVHPPTIDEQLAYGRHVSPKDGCCWSECGRAFKRACGDDKGEDEGSLIHSHDTLRCGVEPAAAARLHQYDHHRYATGDHVHQQHRTDGGMNWDASGRLRGSPGFSVPRDGYDDWVLSVPRASCAVSPSGRGADGDFIEMISCDTYQTSRRSRLPPEALAAINVQPPEVHWPQSEAVRHILEEEDEQDAALFAMQKSLALDADKPDVPEDVTTDSKAPVVIGNTIADRIRQDARMASDLSLVSPHHPQNVVRHQQPPPENSGWRQSGIDQRQQQQQKAENRRSNVIRNAREPSSPSRRPMAEAMQNALDLRRKQVSFSGGSKRVNTPLASETSVTPTPSMRTDPTRSLTLAPATFHETLLRDRRQQQRERIFGKSLSVPGRMVDREPSNDDLISRSTAGERASFAQGRNTVSRSPRPRRRHRTDDARVLSRIERAVDLGLQLRRQSRLQQMQEEMDMEERERLHELQRLAQF